MLIVLVGLIVSCNQATPTSTETPITSQATSPPNQTATPTITPTSTPIATAVPTETAVVPTETTVVSPTPSQPIQFTLASQAQRSLLPTVDDGVFATELTGTGATIYHEGQFHMFYNAIQGGWPPTDILIGYATSADGLNWTRSGDEPVLIGSQLPYEGHTIYASSIVIAEDGRWLLYFHIVTASTAEGAGDSIGVASAPAPTGPWTIHDEILLAPDPNGWDSYALWAPSVVRTEAGYFMYYSGLGPPPEWDRAVGLATSPDGYHWTRHGAPILTASDNDDAWDSHRIEQSVVTITPDGFVMVYRADQGSGNFSGFRSAFGYALSSDGIQWHRPQETPILQPNAEPVWQTLWSAGLAHHDNTYYLYVETDGPYRGTRLYATTYQGALPH